MDRDGPFGQSRGHWELGNVALRDLESEEEVSELFLFDWYHAFLDTRLSTQMLTFAAFYIVGFCIFAVLFLLISKPCGLDLDGDFFRAYLLSVETMMTIGYGVPDPYMRGCWQAPVVLTVQVLLQLLMSACLVGVVFQGISRPQSRASTIIFSEQAVIRSINGIQYLMFRICDLRLRHSLVESHVRCYCLHRHPTRGYQFSPLRLEHPDDSLGGCVLLTLPTVIVHRIDAWSPLAPSRENWQGNGMRKVSIVRSATSDGELELMQERDHHRNAVWPGTVQRMVDCEAGNRQSCICPVCGESFNTAEHLELHCRYNADSDITCELDETNCHRELSHEELAHLSHQDPTRQELETHLATQFCEVVVLVEGIEPTTSSTLQSRHSYVIGGTDIPNDVVWDMTFAECMRVPHGEQTGLALDLGRFHALVPPGLQQV